MTDWALETRDLEKRFGSVRAVDGVSLRVPAGAVLGLVGPNGAGKTTTLGLLTGLLSPSRGEILVAGRPLRAGAPPRERVAALPQDSALPSGRRVRDELTWLSRLDGFRAGEARRRVDRALESTSLTELAGRRIGHLSHGQRRRVAIAQALLGDHPVVILDEPTAGVDPRSALAVRRDLAALTQGRTVVWSSHDLAEVEELCTHVVILDRGRVAAQGRMDELRGAGRVLRIELAPSRAVAPELEALVGALAGVDGVEMDDEGAHLVLHCDPARSIDEVTRDVLQLLLGRGLFVRGVSRGERFAERFWAATQPER